MVPMSAPVDFVIAEKAARRNMPNIPPLNMEANFHHALSALFTFIIPIATIIPKRLIIREEVYNIFIAFLSEIPFLLYRL